MKLLLTFAAALTVGALAYAQRHTGAARVHVDPAICAAQLREAAFK
jgi:hypothetical protein